MNPLVTYFGGLASGILLSVVTAIVNDEAREFWLRIRKRDKPQFSLETHKNAQLALIRAEEVFNQAINGAGFLTYPWIIKGGNVSLDEIQEGLRSASAAIPKKEFIDALVVINEEIFEVWHSHRRNPPQDIYFESQTWSETNDEKRARLRGDKLAEKQLEAAERGRPAAEMARGILDKLSRNL